VNERHTVVQNGETFYVTWDNPLQSYAVDKQNPKPDPCEGCPWSDNWAECDQRPECPGQTYSSVINLYGPMTGKLIRDEGVFEKVLLELGFEPKAARQAVRVCESDRQLRKTYKPRTDLQKLMATLAETSIMKEMK
jgi:hypothetical protein